MCFSVNIKVFKICHLSWWISIRFYYSECQIITQPLLLFAFMSLTPKMPFLVTMLAIVFLYQVAYLPNLFLSSKETFKSSPTFQPNNSASPAICYIFRIVKYISSSDNCKTPTAEMKMKNTMYNFPISYKAQWQKT